MSLDDWDEFQNGDIPDSVVVPYSGDGDWKEIHFPPEVWEDARNNFEEGDSSISIAKYLEMDSRSSVKIVGD